MAHYIGRTISLISNSNIRYLGVLHEINSEKSTVSLKQVKSFGTEGRRLGVNEIPPSESVYEFIVFRGSDVKDLKIQDPRPPPPPPPLVAPADPAIIQTLEYPARQQPTEPPVYSQPQPLPVRPPPTYSAAPSYTAEAVSATTKIPPQAQPQTQPQAQPQARSSESRVPAQNSSNNTTRRGSAHPPSQSLRQKFNTDFDFTESAARLSRETLSSELGGQVAGQFYNRSSSFFDNISSSSKDRTEGNSEQMQRSEERALNLETFGQASVPRGRGGGYRGRGPRGRGRGRAMRGRARA